MVASVIVAIRNDILKQSKKEQSYVPIEMALLDRGKLSGLFFIFASRAPLFSLMPFCSRPPVSISPSYCAPGTVSACRGHVQRTAHGHVKGRYPTKVAVLKHFSRLNPFGSITTQNQLLRALRALSAYANAPPDVQYVGRIIRSVGQKGDSFLCCVSAKCLLSTE